MLDPLRVSTPWHVMHGPSLNLSRPYPAKTQEGQVETNVVHVHPDSLWVRVREASIALVLEMSSSQAELVNRCEGCFRSKCCMQFLDGRCAIPKFKTMRHSVESLLPRARKQDESRQYS